MHLASFLRRVADPRIRGHIHDRSDLITVLHGSILGVPGGIGIDISLQVACRYIKLFLHLVVRRVLGHGRSAASTSHTTTWCSLLHFVVHLVLGGLDELEGFA